MRITIVTGFFLPVPPLRGGSTEKIWHRLAAEFARAGHAVTFVSRRWPGLPDRETVAGVTHIRIPGTDHARALAANLWHDLRWGLRVARALPPGDVVICNTVTLPVWLRAAKPAAGKVVAVLARMPKGHGRAYGRVDLLLALSARVAEQLRAENASLAPKLAPFPYPIDYGLHVRARQAAAASGPALTIGYVGRIHPDKGIRQLLAAAAALATRPGLPDWRLELTGPWTVPEGGGGEAFRAELEREFGAALGPRLRFHGPEFDPVKLAARYASLDVFCYPSRDRGETFGVAVAEAMAAGTPVVVSGLPCFAELVTPEVTGLAYDHEAPDAETRLAHRLALLLQDAALRAELGRAAQAHVARYDYAASAREVLATLSRCLEPAAPGI